MIRRATSRDGPAIATIWNAVIRETSRTFTTVEKAPADIALLQSDRPFWVADQGGAVVGFACYGPFRAGPGYARTVEHTVHVADGARGRGIGRALVEATAAHAQGAGMHVMVAGISGESPDGVAFHRALGFEEVGRLSQVGRKFDRWQDLILMQKML